MIFPTTSTTERQRDLYQKRENNGTQARINTARMIDGGGLYLCLEVSEHLMEGVALSRDDGIALCGEMGYAPGAVEGKTVRAHYENGTPDLRDRIIGLSPDNR